MALPCTTHSPNPADWRCDETGVTENLWLNLSTGFIGSGRKVRMCVCVCVWLLAYVCVQGGEGCAMRRCCTKGLGP